jgi:hypothetical protein
MDLKNGFWSDPRYPESVGSMVEIIFMAAESSS